MAIRDEINNAIESHLAWKTKLLEVIDTGNCLVTPELIKAEDNCAFGWWLNNEIAAEEKLNGHYLRVKDLHSKFHIAAAHIVQLALSGSLQEAIDKMGEGQTYSSISSELIHELDLWRKEINK